MKEIYTVKTDKTARVVVLGNVKTANQIWIALHGYGQNLGRFGSQLQTLVDHNTAVIVPEGLHRFYTKGFNGDVGASWMTREDRVSDIQDYVEYLNKVAYRFLENHHTLQVLGFSQGAATACRWLSGGRFKAQNVVLWAGLVPPDLNLELGVKNLSKSKLILASSPTDPYRTDTMWNEQYNQLNTYGLKYDEFEYEGGHKIIPEALRRLVETYINPLLSN